MTNEQKKDWAKLLYLKENMTQREIAARVDVSEVTLSKWVVKEDWSKLKKSLYITKQAILANTYDQLEELINHIRAKPEGARYANSKEADTQAKLTAAIKNLETEINLASIVDVFMDFTDWVRRVDVKKAQEIVELQDAYIKSKHSAATS